jgi:magnesium chelatase subunit I
MHAEIRTDPILRVKVVEERTSFDQNSMVWIENYEAQQQELRDKIVSAQNYYQLLNLNMTKSKISEVCSQLDVDGLRGDIVTNRAVRLMLPIMAKLKVTTDDISKIITLCLRHRLRKDPLEAIDSGDKVSKVFKEVLRSKTNVFIKSFLYSTKSMN